MNATFLQRISCNAFFFPSRDHLTVKRYHEKGTLVGSSAPRCRKKKWPNTSKTCQKIAKASFSFKVMVFKIAPKVVEYLGYFSKKICLHDLFKIAQSGHAGWKGFLRQCLNTFFVAQSCVFIWYI